jgi:hypothetical protein
MCPNDSEQDRPSKATLRNTSSRTDASLERHPSIAPHVSAAEMPHYVCEGIVFDPVQKVGSFSDTSVASPAETMSTLISGNPRSERLDAWIESRETKLVKHSHYTH